MPGPSDIVLGVGAAATLIGATPADRELIGPFALGTDGRGANQIIVKAGGLRCPPTAATAVEKEDAAGNWRSEENLFMDGAGVFGFAMKTVPAALGRLFEKCGLTL